MKLVFASHNPNKIIEIKALLPQNFEILSLDDIGCHDEIPETADTIEGNALLKANFVATHYGLDCFADDSGLEVDALNGAPGVFSARYAGNQKNSQDNNKKLLQEMQGKSNRKANFKTVIALNLKGENYLFTGIVNGKIALEQRGIHGFGYDPVFEPEGFSYTFAEISATEKAKISHRARAVTQLIAFLKN
ncbi:non-canonical purine NTP diphosphatase [Flavobacterium sp. NST-5]|uniref:dITP/XTP pyrophosphatase n=1 Tax=Flavobacterium ichthyis TaxID=2698827 RepID=A0ABW9Z617_9FLAO|nr:non-canonical purine NTP diphosphatase [Flavobacterium ichthyis]NBL64012.1 non-canonical purine NTP diphosphatase [Flavobacterium ichthyis]